VFNIMNSDRRLETLLGKDDISFDWHSKAVRHLLSEGTLAKLILGKKKPFPGTNETEGGLSPGGD
jgi:hypothetical protein